MSTQRVTSICLRSSPNSGSCETDSIIPPTSVITTTARIMDQFASWFCARLAEIAQRSQQSYLAFLAEILSAEVDERIERRRQRRIHEARFPRTKRLPDFDLDAAPTINPATIATLASGAYLDAGEPVVLL